MLKSDVPGRRDSPPQSSKTVTKLWLVDGGLVCLHVCSMEQLATANAFFATHCDRIASLTGRLGMASFQHLVYAKRRSRPFWFIRLR